MPEPVWIYLMALLYFTNLTSCWAMADAFDSVSCFLSQALVGFQGRRLHHGLSPDFCVPHPPGSHDVSRA